MPDVIGFVSFALFLLIVGIVIAANPGIFGDLRDWLEPMIARGAFLRPPEALIGSAILLFALSGFSGLFTATLRAAVERRKTKALSDALSAVGGLVFAYLLTYYQSRGLSAAQVLAIEVAVVGMLLIAYIVLAVYWLGVRFPAMEPWRTQVRR